MLGTVPKPARTGFHPQHNQELLSRFRPKQNGTTISNLINEISQFCCERNDTLRPIVFYGIRPILPERFVRVRKHRSNCPQIIPHRISQIGHFGTNELLRIKAIGFCGLHTILCKTFVRRLRLTKQWPKWKGGGGRLETTALGACGSGRESRNFEFRVSSFGFPTFSLQTCWRWGTGGPCQRLWRSP
jgi:hypothetical protein